MNMKKRAGLQKFLHPPVWFGTVCAVLKIPFFERSNLRESGSKTSMHGGSMCYKVQSDQKKKMMTFSRFFLKF